MSSYKYLLKNVGLFTISEFASKFITFFMLPLYTYYLSTEEYAVIDLIQVTQNLIIPVVTLSIADAVLRFAFDRNENTGEIFTLGVCVAAVASVLVVIGCFAGSGNEVIGQYLWWIIWSMITMMFSGGMVSTFMVVRSLGLVGSRLSIILPTSVNAVYIILMMNAYRGVDQSYVEAAEIDGAGHFRIMFQVMLPQCLNMAFVIILFTVVQQWNSWMEASMYLPTDRELWPLQLWIKEISAQSADWGQTANPDYNRSLIEYCVIVISLVPIIVIATVFQKWIEKAC